MSIDLDTLNPKAIRVQKSASSPSYMSILHAVPMQPRTKVQKAFNKPKQPARKAEQPQPFKPTPKVQPSSTIGNNGRPNASSHVSGAPAAAPKPTGIDALLAAVTALEAVAKITTPPPRDTTPEAMAATLAESRRQQEAADWNAGRSAAQRQGFTFHAAKSDNSTVALGKSAHAVRMNGNKFAPAPTVARKEERRQWFNDSYMARLGRK